MRTHLKASKFVVVKAGTSTVSHDDGTPSLPRLGAIVEAVSQLMRQGTKVILVSSGAVGCGRSVLRKQAALHRTLRDHMKNQEMNEGAGYSAAAAAAGQLALMSLYETLFATQEIEPSQFLVTRRDFVDEACRKNLQHSIQAIMDVGMVPIINENDAVSGNAGYSEVPDGCFSDNDGLAALVAKLVGADCLIMLTDVEGLYDRPPSEAGARLVREVHPASLKDWKFGGISKGGRGGMEAKVNAALGALEVGIKSVVLASGSEPDVGRGAEIIFQFLVPWLVFPWLSAGRGSPSLSRNQGRGAERARRRRRGATPPRRRMNRAGAAKGARRRRRRHVLQQRHRAEAVARRGESVGSCGPER